MSRVILFSLFFQLEQVLLKNGEILDADVCVIGIGILRDDVLINSECSHVGHVKANEEILRLRCECVNRFRKGLWD